MNESLVVGEFADVTKSNTFQEKTRTPPFLAKYVAAALEPYAHLLPYLFAFHANIGWGDKAHTVVPILMRVNDHSRPAMVWLFGPLPSSPLSCQSVVDIMMYLFDLGYSVRWTSSCSYCDVNIRDAPLHRCVFSILACRDDASVHPTDALSFEPIPDVAQYNQMRGIPPVALFHEGKIASRMHKTTISTLQMRSIFQHLLGGSAAVACTNAGTNLQTKNAYERFFVEEHFLNVRNNDPACFLCGDGYGSDGVFGVVRRRSVCRLNHDVSALRWSEEFTNWMTSFKDGPRVRKRIGVPQELVDLNKKLKTYFINYKG